MRKSLLALLTTMLLIIIALLLFQNNLFLKETTTSAISKVGYSANPTIHIMTMDHIEGLTDVHSIIVEKGYKLDKLIIKNFLINETGYEHDQMFILPNNIKQLTSEIINNGDLNSIEFDSTIVEYDVVLMVYYNAEF